MGWQLLEKLGGELSTIKSGSTKRQMCVLFTIVPDLLDHLRVLRPISAVAYDDRFETIRAVPLLILDDLGTEHATPWTREKLFEISSTATTRRCRP